MAKKLIIIDDNLETALSVQKFFTQKGFECIVSNDAIEAFTLVYENAPDVIITDIMMSKMGGYEFSRMIKNNNFTSQIPIVIFSALERNIDKFWAYRSGVDNYVIKKDGLEALFDVVVDLIQKKPVSPDYKCRLLGAKIPCEFSFSDEKNKENLIAEFDLIKNSQMDKIPLVVKIFRVISKYINCDVVALSFFSKDEKKLFLDIGKCALSPIALFELKGKIAKREENNVEIEVVSKRDGNFAIDDLSSFKHCVELFCGVQNVSCGFLGIYFRNELAPNELKFLQIIKKEVSKIVEKVYLKDLKARNALKGVKNVYSQVDFEKVLSHEINWHKKYDKPLALIMLEISNLSGVEELYGAQYCDFVVAKLATIISDCLSENDFLYRGEDNIFKIIMTTSSDVKVMNSIEYIKTKAQDPCWLALDGDYGINLDACGLMYSSEYKNIWDFIEAGYEVLDIARGAGDKIIVR